MRRLDLFLLGVTALALAQSKEEKPPTPQPIPFNHKQHVALGVKCLDCHAIKAPGDRAGFPSEAICTGCHLTIKKDSPLRPTFTVSLANGYNGYLPTPAQHALGGYETWRARSSYLEVNASRRVTDTVLELLKAAKR